MGPSGKSPSCQCSKKIRDLAALERMQAAGFKEADPDEMDRSEWRAAFDAERQTLHRLHAVAVKVGDTCLRASYLEWIDYYESRLKDNERLLSKPSEPTFLQKIHRDIEEARKCERDGMVPPLESIQ
jgi:hypothetical protein